MAISSSFGNAIGQALNAFAQQASSNVGSTPGLLDQIKHWRDNQSDNFNTDRFGSKPQAGTNQARNAQNEEKNQNNSLIDLGNSATEQYMADNAQAEREAGRNAKNQQGANSVIGASDVGTYNPGFTSGDASGQSNWFQALAQAMQNFVSPEQAAMNSDESTMQALNWAGDNSSLPSGAAIIAPGSASSADTINQGLQSSLNQTIGKEDAPSAGASIMVDPLGKAIEDFYGVDVPDDYILKDDNGKAILPDADHEWDTVKALLRGYAENNGMDADELLGRYNTLTDFQMNGTEDEWRSVMLDPRVFGNYTYLLNQYVPEDQRQYVLDNYQNLSSDDQLRQIAEAAFKNMWDTQKQWSMEDFANGSGNSYTQDRYQHTFSPASILSLAGWIADQGYGPGLTGSEFNDVINAEDGNPRLINTTLDNWFNSNNGDIDARQGGRYNQAVQNLYASSGASGEETGGITGEEAAAANRRILEYILGAAYLNGDAEDAAMRAERAGNNWVDQIFSMDPNKYFSPEFAQTTQGQQLAAEGRIYDQYGDKSFAEQNPFFGNNDYVGTETIGQLQNGLPITMGPLGSRYLDLDALADYGVPIVGVDQIMKNIGWYRGDKDIDRTM